MTSQVNRKQGTPSKGVSGGEGASAGLLAPRVEHGVLGGAEAQQVPHLVAELGQVLPQVVEVLHRGLVRALHLLPRGRQVAMHQAAHDLLVVLVALLLQVFPLLFFVGKESGDIEESSVSNLPPTPFLYLTFRLFCLFTLPLEVCEQIHLLMLVTR